MTKKTKKNRRPHLKLKSFRVGKKLTQEDMARSIGISTNAYTLKENGYRDFTLSEILAMAIEHSLNPSEIFFSEESIQKETKRKKTKPA